MPHRPNAGSFKPGPDVRRSGGRPKGRPNNATIARNIKDAKELKDIEATIANNKTMPLDFMLRKMRDPRESPAEQFIAARAAAPYCHPQLQAVAHRHLDADGKPIAPVISVTVMQAPVEQVEQPKLTHEPPKSDETVQ